MKNYLLRRLIQSFLVLFGITFLSFVLLRSIPGDPCRIIHGRFVPQEIIEACRIEHGFHLPVGQQYLAYLGDILSGEALAGQSLVYQRPALEVLLERLPPTIFLSLYSSLLSVLIALPLGLGAVLKPGAFFDGFVRGATVTALTLPSFWTGLLLIYFFSIQLQLFPVSGYGEGFLGHLHHLFLPALTLAVANGALLARVLRASLLESITSAHVLAARSRGLPWRIVFSRYVLRNSLISPVTLLGLQTAWLLSGTVVVENVFALPGLGALLVQSILNRDYNLVQQAALLFAVIASGASLLADLAYPLLDPRVRYG